MPAASESPDSSGIELSDRTVRSPVVASDPPDVVISRHVRMGSRRTIFTVVVLGFFMSALDSTIVITALPVIHRDLHATLNWAGWTITIYQLGQILSMPFAGRIADLVGRRRLFLASLATFTTASLACGFANSIYLLVLLRCVQAIGSGSFMPVASGIVADRFGPDRDRAIGMFTSVFPIGGIIGPLLGGLFVTYWSWRGIFLVNVPIGIALLIVAWRVIPESRAGSPEPIDLSGVLLLGALILTSMLGISFLGDSQSVALYVVVSILEIAAVVVAVSFVRHVRAVARPFIPPRLLFGRGFASMNAVNMVVGAVSLGMAALVPLYAEERYNLSLLDSSTLLTARSVGVVLVAAIAAIAMRRIGTRLPMVVGTIVMMAGLVLMALPASFGVTAYVWLSVATGINGVGVGMTMPAANNATMQLAPTEVASISGIRGMFRQSGAILTISIMTAFIARSTHPADVQIYGLLVCSGFLVLSLIPIVFVIPDHRGRW